MAEAVERVIDLDSSVESAVFGDPDPDRVVQLDDRLLVRHPSRLLERHIPVRALSVHFLCTLFNMSPYGLRVVGIHPGDDDPSHVVEIPLSEEDHLLFDAIGAHITRTMELEVIGTVMLPGQRRSGGAAAFSVEKRPHHSDVERMNKVLNDWDHMKGFSCRTLKLNKTRTGIDRKANAEQFQVITLKIHAKMPKITQLANLRLHTMGLRGKWVPVDGQGHRLTSAASFLDRGKNAAFIYFMLEEQAEIVARWTRAAHQKPGFFTGVLDGDVEEQLTAFEHFRRIEEDAAIYKERQQVVDGIDGALAYAQTELSVIEQMMDRVDSKVEEGMKELQALQTEHAGRMAIAKSIKEALSCICCTEVVPYMTVCGTCGFAGMCVNCANYNYETGNDIPAVMGSGRADDVANNGRIRYTKDRRCVHCKQLPMFDGDFKILKNANKLVSSRSCDLTDMLTAVVLDTEGKLMPQKAASDLAALRTAPIKSNNWQGDGLQPLALMTPEQHDSLAPVDDLMLQEIIGVNFVHLAKGGALAKAWMNVELRNWADRHKDLISKIVADIVAREQGNVAAFMKHFEPLPTERQIRAAIETGNEPMLHYLKDKDLKDIHYWSPLANTPNMLRASIITDLRAPTSANSRNSNRQQQTAIPVGTSMLPITIDENNEGGLTAVRTRSGTNNTIPIGNTPTTSRQTGRRRQRRQTTQQAQARARRSAAADLPLLETVYTGTRSRRGRALRLRFPPGHDMFGEAGEDDDDDQDYQEEADEDEDYQEEEDDEGPSAQRRRTE